MSASAFHIYDSNAVSVVVAGIPIDGGFGEDEFLKITPGSDAFEIKKGVDGSITRSKTNDRSAEATITLMQTSAANDALSALLNIDLAANNGAGVGPFLVRDKSGRALYTAEHCWIMRPPDVEMKKGASDRVWKIQIANLIRFDGGS